MFTPGLSGLLQSTRHETIFYRTDVSLPDSLFFYTISDYNNAFLVDSVNSQITLWLL